MSLQVPLLFWSPKHKKNNTLNGNKLQLNKEYVKPWIRIQSNPSNIKKTPAKLHKKSKNNVIPSQDTQYLSKTYDQSIIVPHATKELFPDYTSKSSNNNDINETANDSFYDSDFENKIIKDALQFETENKYKKTICYKCLQYGHKQESCNFNGIICHLCGQIGHEMKSCNRIDCHNCFELGHTNTQCPLWIKK